MLWRVTVAMTGITFTCKSKYLVTKDEEEQLSWLCYSDGQIWPAYLDNDKIGFVILAKNKNSSIVSWGLVFDRADFKTLFIYTRKDYRRNKIGTKIYKIATETFGDLDVSFHNTQASRFYNSVSKFK